MPPPKPPSILPKPPLILPQSPSHPPPRGRGLLQRGLLLRSGGFVIRPHGEWGFAIPEAAFRITNAHTPSCRIANPAEQAADSRWISLQIQQNRRRESSAAFPLPSKGRGQGVGSLHILHFLRRNKTSTEPRSLWRKKAPFHPLSRGRGLLWQGLLLRSGGFVIRPHGEWGFAIP